MGRVATVCVSVIRRLVPVRVVALLIYLPRRERRLLKLVELLLLCRVWMLAVLLLRRLPPCYVW